MPPGSQYCLTTTIVSAKLKHDGYECLLLLLFLQYLLTTSREIYLIRLHLKPFLLLVKVSGIVLIFKKCKRKETQPFSFISIQNKYAFH